MTVRAVAVLLCAGRSRRMAEGLGREVQKTLLELDGEAVALRSARALLAALSVEGLVVVCRQDDRGALERALVPVADGILSWAEGGAERVDSVRAGARAASEHVEAGDVLLIHDAARCLVRSERVEEVAQAASLEGAAVLAARVRDTIKRSVDGTLVDGTPPRSELWAAQTPQAVRAGLLLTSLDRAELEGFVPTDDVALVERYGGGRVRLVEGDDDNLKLTSASDLVIAGELLARRREA